MATTITTGNGTNGGAGISSDTTGILEIRTGTTSGAGTTAMTVNASQNVGIGLTPNASQGRLQVVNFSITGGAPATSGTTDANQLTTFGMGATQLRFGAYASGAAWVQQSANSSYATNYDLVLQPNGGNVGIGTSSPGGRLDVVGTVGALTNAIVRSTDSNMARLTLSNSNRNWTISNYGAQFSPNGALVFADETAGSSRAWIDTSGNFAFNSGYGSVATTYGCRAWVNFNGTGTVAIRASGNVTSITDNGTGDYTVNFTNAMPDVNYSAVITSAATGTLSMAWNGNQTPATTSYRFNTMFANNTAGGGTVVDSLYVNFAIFR